MALMGGFDQIGNDEIKILGNDANTSTDIDLQEAQQALEKAKDHLHKATGNLHKAKGKRKEIEVNLALQISL